MTIMYYPLNSHVPHCLYLIKSNLEREQSCPICRRFGNDEMTGKLRVRTSELSMVIKFN